MGNVLIVLNHFYDVLLYYSGIRRSEISRTLGIPRQQQLGLSTSIYRSRNSVENLTRSGTPTKLSEWGSRTLLRLVKQNRKQTLSDITGIFNHARNSTVSKRTVHQKSYSEGFHRRVVVKRIRIPGVNWKSRVNWCRTNRRRTVDQYWRMVIFNDDCKIDIGKDNKVFIWRKVGEDWSPCCLTTPPSPEFNLMIWGFITHEGVGTVTRWGRATLS